MNKTFTSKEIEEIEIEASKRCAETNCKQCEFNNGNYCRTALILKIASLK